MKVANGSVKYKGGQVIALCVNMYFYLRNLFH